MTQLDRMPRAQITAESVDLLPSREALAWINITNITAVNIAIAVNAASFGSTAAAVALQNVSGWQH